MTGIGNVIGTRMAGAFHSSGEGSAESVSSSAVRGRLQEVVSVYRLHRNLLKLNTRMLRFVYLECAIKNLNYLLNKPYLRMQ